MTDTPAGIERMQRDKLMARSGEERFVMGSEMFDSALEMVKASLPPNLSDSERRQVIFKRIYGKKMKLG